jgi:cytoskeletal protein CcmA (bactofilin family)
MASDDDKADGTNTTTIGPTIIIRGRLKVDENLTVRGRIDAEIASSKALTVESSGVVKANVRVRSARVSGILIGNVDAHDKIEIASDGRVVGDLRSPRIVINDGAAFRGKVDMQPAEEQPAEAARVGAVAADVAAPPAAVIVVPGAMPVVEAAHLRPGRPPPKTRH